TILISSPLMRQQVVAPSQNLNLVSVPNYHTPNWRAIAHDASKWRRVEILRQLWATKPAIT
ncbi:hypothetical protein, partial [Geomonas sp.]|uniref:hypothetical protein n=1 Tax=Geomonas sp. TaxID=2651584 RepID=UPI002B4A1D0E